MQVEHYQRVLSETEEMLQSLQRSVEQEERGWREQEQAHALERSTWEHRERELSARCQALEGDLQQLQGLQQVGAAPPHIPSLCAPFRRRRHSARRVFEA